MDLLCIGNAIVDVFAEIAPRASPEAALLAFANFRKQFGLNDSVQHITPENAAAILAALAPAVCGTAIAGTPPTENAPAIAIRSGGCAANTAKMAARLGLTVAFAGAVGSANGVDGAPAVGGTFSTDRFGAIFEEELKRSGVALYLAHKQSPTGLFISVTLRQQRIIAASPSAALELEQNDVDEALFAQTRVLMLEGFLLRRKNLAGYFLAMAEKYNLTLALDAGTADTAAEHAALIHSWFGLYPLILFLNKKEAEAFTEALGFGPHWENFFVEASRNREPTEFPHSSGKSVVVAVKLAERGAAVFADGDVYRAATKPVEAADSTGAGDAFAAGFLAAWLRGEDPLQCGHAGNAAAATVLR